MVKDINTKIGIIGGSGLYKLEGLKKIKEIQIDTPFGKPSDSIITGQLNETGMAFLPRHGRDHDIIPSQVNNRANIWAMKKIGVERIISVSAVGSMMENIHPGDVVIVDQFFDRTKNRPCTFFSNGLVAHIAFSDPVCPVLFSELNTCCKKIGIKVKKGGTYICMEGPQFSTFAESRIYRKWGVDVIGMTALPEAKLAREAEMCYATIALVTDYDCWHPDHDSVTVELVIKQLTENSDKAKKILSVFVERFSKILLPSCSCSRSLEKAIMTSADKIDKKLKDDLDIIVGKHIK
ncbi:S-methyl-5'-thioadenosine phosphorylase [Elusimicrobiota bacterium]